MKKHGLRKLELGRETLRALDPRLIREAAGANTRQNSCDTVTLVACTVTDRTACASSNC